MATVSQLRQDHRTKRARAQGRDAREALLQAAQELFAERGYRDASVDEIAERAGYSKGAVYWHFPSKDDLFFALMEERVDHPWEEGIKLMETASPEQDIAPEASQRFVQMLQGQRELLLVEREYWSQAVRDPKLRARYAKRQRRIRTALGKAIAARLEHLGAAPAESPEDLAMMFMALALGLAQERVIDPKAVPDALLGEAFALIYAGHVASSRAQQAPRRG
jgi:AcrR family transcriptional regulator